MKKNNILYIIAFLSVTFTGCDLDYFPHDKIEQSQSFQTLKDAQSWNKGVYAYFRGRQSGIYTYTTDVQADQLNASLEFGNRNGQPHIWSSFYADDYSIRDIWRGYYGAISNANLIIENYPKMKLDKDGEKAELNRYMGDTYFVRAYYYSQLALFWSKAYNPSSADKDLSVPLQLNFDVNAQPARATLKQVYTQILSDIAEAKKLLANIEGTPGSNYFTIDAVIALEARVKLYMQDWAGAYAAANKLVSENKYKLINNEADFKAMWTNDKPQETIYQVLVSKPDELGNSNGIYINYDAGSDIDKPDFLPSKTMIDKYDDSDIRKKVFFKVDSIEMSGQKYYNIYVVDKFPGNPDYFVDKNSNYRHQTKTFRIAEMYLIAAEAAFKQSKNADALKMLNALREARGISSLGSVTMNDIKDERYRELAFEGFRLFDLKRWNEGFTRNAPQNESAVVAGEDYVGKTVEAGNDKFVWGIPTNDIKVNTNLVQNPGW